jgi:hypothetical protein
VILEIENFMQDPIALRNQALTSQFIDYAAHDGQVYKRVQIVDLPAVRFRIEEAVGPCEFLGTGFRLNYNGELPNAAIHSDLGWGTHALVLYLSDGPGGTAFWKHRKTGASEILEGQVDLLEMIEGDWDYEDRWQQLYLCEGKFNKAVIYPSKLFHSRFPFEAYGSCPETGRLIAIAFFNLR